MARPWQLHHLQKNNDKRNKQTKQKQRWKWMWFLAFTTKIMTIKTTFCHMMSLYGCFLKWWYPQNTPKWSFLVGKPMVVGYHYFWKHPYIPRFLLVGLVPFSFFRQSIWPPPHLQQFDVVREPVLNGDCQDVGDFCQGNRGQRDTLENRSGYTHRIHAWYIYLHEWLISYGKCREIYHTWDGMDRSKWNIDMISPWSLT